MTRIEDTERDLRIACRNVFARLSDDFQVTENINRRSAGAGEFIIVSMDGSLKPIAVSVLSPLNKLSEDRMKWIEHWSVGGSVRVVKSRFDAELIVEQICQSLLARDVPKEEQQTTFDRVRSDERVAA